MRPFAETNICWKATFAGNTSLSDLKASVRNNKGQSPCEIGLRSICWKAFLLFENLDRSTWSKTLKDSRSAYTSLREHFLHDVEHPDDLSAADPLADDETSPWNTLRRDEILRDEIYQDVERCMPENLYFREPTTQSTLLDILFIFCKLNADIGYRQGMHEVLAPILWVVSRDAIDPSGSEEPIITGLEPDLIKEALDHTFVEHDAFSIFCIIMQTVKCFYETGSSNPQPTADGVPSSSPIVERSKRIHEEYLLKVDPELTKHLINIEILPQIFVIRWIRLLFGREFPFDDVLCLWDVLFAEDPALELVDFICVAMLLRVRWQLMEADYSSALTLLLRYPVPPASQPPSTFVSDALYLRQNLSLESGSHIILRYSGKSPLAASRPTSSTQMNTRGRKPTLHTATPPDRPRTPIRSPARFLQEQGGIEGILQEAAKGVYSRGEKWGVSKALRGAVQGLQSGSNSPRRLPLASVRWSLDDGKPAPSENEQITSRIEALEVRNKALAKMLENAMKDLLGQQELFDKEKEEAAANAVSLAIAKVQFVQVYLEDSSMPLVPDIPTQAVVENQAQALGKSSKATTDSPPATEQAPIEKGFNPSEGETTQSEPTATLTTPPEPAMSANNTSLNPLSDGHISPPMAQEPPRTSNPNSTANQTAPAVRKTKDKPLPSPFHQPRPTLASSSFSWMLGPDQRKSSFVSASPFPPEKKRESAARQKAGFLFGDEEAESHGPEKQKGKEKKDKGTAEEEGDGFTLGTLRGIPDGL